MDENRDKDRIIALTKKWIERFIIRLSICPFAKVPYERGQIHYKLSESKDLKPALEDVTKVLLNMKKDDSKVSNSFVIFSYKFSFFDLLDLKEITDNFLEISGFEETFQTVVFHPEFMFSDEPLDHPSNFVNRSPYSMLHILRTEEVELAIEHHPDVHDIPYQNKKLLTDLNVQSIEETMSNLLNDKSLEGE